MSSTPIITLMAYRQPAVNGELVETVIRTSSGPVILAGSKLFFRRFAADLAALIGTPALPSSAPVRSGGMGRPRGVGQSLTPERRAAILAQVAACNAGTITRKNAAALLGLTAPAFTGWLVNAEKLASA